MNLLNDEIHSIRNTIEILTMYEKNLESEAEIMDVTEKIDELNKILKEKLRESGDING